MASGERTFGPMHDSDLRSTIAGGERRCAMTPTTVPLRRPKSTVRDAPPRHRQSRFWTVVTAAEVVLACAAVVLDLLVPTFILLALAGISLLARRQGFSSLGFHRIAAHAHLAWRM